MAEYDDLISLLGTSQADKDNAKYMGLLQFGLGTMANNNSRNNPMQALAAGGMQGLQGYQGSLDRSRSDRMNQIQMAELARKLKQQLAIEEELKGAPEPIRSARAMGVPIEKIWERLNPELKDTPGYKAQVAAAVRGAELPFVGQEAEARSSGTARGELPYVGQMAKAKAAGAAAGELPYVGQMAEARSSGTARGELPYVEKKAFAQNMGKDKAEMTIAPVKDAAAAQKALRTVDYDPKTGEDKVTSLLSKATGGFMGNVVDMAGAAFNKTLPGRSANTTLTTIANQLTLDMMPNGSLGSQISNTDRDFIQAKLGDVGNAYKTTGERYDAWLEVRRRMSATGLLKPDMSKTPSATDGQWAVVK